MARSTKRTNRSASTGFVSTMSKSVSSHRGGLDALGAVVAGTVAPLLAYSLASLAWGMAAFTVASFALWLTYQRRAHTSLKEWSP